MPFFIQRVTILVSVVLVFLDRVLPTEILKGSQNDFSL